MTEDQVIKMPREQLYNEIWEISAVGVSKKYRVAYAVLLRICRENDIPIPPPGYWTQLRHGKSVSKKPLVESLITEVSLLDVPKPKRSQALKPTTKSKSSKQKIEKEKQPSDATSQIQRDRFIRRTVAGKYNTYNRDKLYEEVWTKPVVEVALHYGVSDVAIHKICKSLNI